MAYFPALDKCLTGKEPLISWTAVLQELTRDHEDDVHYEVQTFLANEETLDLLTRSAQPFAKTNSNSRQDFDTRTAPIQVSTSHNIDRFKTDSLWLSKELDIHETAALRLIITEHLSRPADLLLNRILDESSARKQEKGQGHTDLNDVVRHRRLLQVYLQESSALKQVATLLIAAGLPGGDSSKDIWLRNVASKMRDGMARAAQGSSVQFNLMQNFEKLLGYLKDPSSLPQCFQSDFVLHDDLHVALLQDMISTLGQLLVFQSLSPVADARTVMQWYKSMDSVSFFGRLEPSTSLQSELVINLQALTSVFSASLLDVSRTIEEVKSISNQASSGVSYPSLQPPYITDDHCVRDINTILYQASTEIHIAAPALYAWAIITTYIRDLAHLQQEEALQIEEAETGRHGSITRRMSAIEQKYDTLQDRALGFARDDPARFFAEIAVERQSVYAFIAQISKLLTSAYSATLELPLSQIARSSLFDIVQESLPLVAYDEPVVDSMLAVLSPTLPNSPKTAPHPALSTRFWNDQVHCIPCIYNHAEQRFVQEIPALVELMSSLLTNLLQNGDEFMTLVARFENLPVTMITLPEDFSGYELSDPEEGRNTIRLMQSIPIFVQTAAFRSSEMEDANGSALQTTQQLAAVEIPSGTYGTIMNEAKPFVAEFRHSFSGLNFLGLLLASLLPNAKYSLAAPAPPIDLGVGASVMRLVVIILEGAADKERADYVLSELSANTSGQQDIIAVVIDLLEAELLARAEQTSQPDSTDLLIQCLRFMQVISEYVPERLWAYLVQSSLFGVSNSSSALLMPSTATGDESGVSRLLHEAMRLYQIAVDDALHGLVKRNKTTKPRAGSRFDSPMESLGDISERVVTQALNAYTSLALETLQGLTTRADMSLRMETLCTITTTLNRLLLSVYGVGEVTSSSPTRILRAPAQLILTTLAPGRQEEQPVTSLIATLLPLLQADNRVPKAAELNINARQAHSTLLLAVLLLRIAKASGLTTTNLTTALISSMPVLAPIFALQAQFKQPVAELLMEVVTTIDVGTSDPVSIFSQIDPEQGTQFLRLLTSVDSSLGDAATDCRLWDLFAAACRHNQQWFAMYLVTGVLPKDHIKEKPKVDRTALSHALDQLADIKNLNPERAAALVGFVAEAQKTWSWATSIVRSHYSFKEQALAWLSALKAPDARSRNDNELLVAKEYHLASQLCDVLAVNVHASLELGDKKFSKDVLAHLSFLTQHAAAVNGYNLNLHRTLSDNLSKRFSGLTLVDHKRTTVNPASIGSDFVYDIEIASSLLGHDGSWLGRNRSQSDGFINELKRANSNWSLYQAQISLLKEWKTLIITLADASENDTELTRTMLETVRSCLTSSSGTNLDFPEAAQQLQMRADLAFTLLSKLARSKLDQAQAKHMLYTAWDLVKLNAVDFLVAGAEEDLTYYRTLLQILYMTLRICASSQPPAAPAEGSQAVAKMDLAYESTLVDIMSKTVATGFRALCGNLHESVGHALPRDFALLTAIAKAIISSSTSRPFTAQLADAVAFSGVVRSASSLYSWSDRLADYSNDDPIYGELAIMFLTTISQVPQVAEQMAVENVLLQLGSANLSDYFRKTNGRGPFDSPARMYTIWTDGFLPLCLNMIDAVGAPVIADVSSFIGSFPLQLHRAQIGLQNASPSAKNPRAGALTLGMLSEARDLVTLYQIVEAAKQLGAAEGVDTADISSLVYDIKVVGEDLEAATKSSRSLRDRVTPVTPKEVALYQSSAEGRDDALQAAIVKEITGTLRLING